MNEAVKKQPPPTRQGLARPVNLIWIGLYLVMIAAIWFGMRQARQWALERYGTPAAQEDWQRWVEDVRDQGRSPSPVERRVPKSTIPPALAVMTEHYASCLLGALLLSSALFVSLMVLIRGAFSGGPKET